MMDEQSIVYFYSYILKTPWTYVSQKYNFIPWQTAWLRNDEYPPAVCHYFGITKPWNLNRNEWPDLELWWRIVEHMIKYLPKEYKEIFESFYRKDQLAINNPGCFYCNMLTIESQNHDFVDNDCKIICPFYNKQL
jgi:lipopolysaccharide biosynthesis glycosyltransferase